jgi:hypothetical protein
VKGCDGSSQRLGWSTLARGVAGISLAGSAARSRRKRAAVMGRHGAPRLTRWLKVAGGHAVILVARGGDGWMAHRREFGWRRPAVSQQSEADMWGSRGAGTHLAASRGSRRSRPALHVEMGWGRHRAGPAAEKAAHDDFSNLNPFPIE